METHRGPASSVMGEVVVVRPETVARHLQPVSQITPPHSECSISLGKGLDAVFGTGAMEPGSQKRMELVVSDIEAARKDLIGRGVEVSELFHVDGGRVPGPDPERASYMTYASFSDPDGNTWLLQEVTDRLPGRVWDA